MGTAGIEPTTTALPEQKVYCCLRFSQTSIFTCSNQLSYIPIERWLWEIRESNPKAKSFPNLFIFIKLLYVVAILSTFIPQPALPYIKAPRVVSKRCLVLLKPIPSRYVSNSAITLSSKLFLLTNYLRPVSHQQNLLLLI